MTHESFSDWMEPDGSHLGYLNSLPDHWTQCADLDNLKVHLLDLYKKFSEGDLPEIRKVEDLLVV